MAPWETDPIRTYYGGPYYAQFGIGPKVKYAVGMVVMEEVGKAIAAMQ